jgi:CarD family transcriptional regulator
MRSLRAVEPVQHSDIEIIGMQAVSTNTPAASPVRSAARASVRTPVASQELVSKVPNKLAAAKKPSQIEPALADVAAPASPGVAAPVPGLADAGEPAPISASAPEATPLHDAVTPSVAAPALEEAAANDTVAPKAAPVQHHAFASNAGHRPNVPPQSGLARPPGGIPGRVAPPPRPMAKAEQFAEGDYVVYPTHGVGKVERIAVEEIAGHKLELIHITFEENRMTLRVPVSKARTAGLRKLASRRLFDDAMAVLKGRARIKRTMWSRRAQEYEAKINSGDPLAIAEVVRDLHRNAGQPDQSFSERQIYEAAMDRLAAELAALDRSDKPTAAVKLAEFLKTV